jgi:hypothetical protein
MNSTGTTTANLFANLFAKPTPLLALALFILGGCAETRTYQVSVRNETQQPVTLWLFKQGGPYEDGWKSPDDIAIDSPKDNEPIGGVVVPPGKIATAGPIKGQFNSDARAVLRVYRGAHPFNELLAIDRNSGDRKDAPLPQGASAFIIEDKDAKLSLEPMMGAHP